MRSPHDTFFKGFTYPTKSEKIEMKKKNNNTIEICRVIDAFYAALEA